MTEKLRQLMQSEHLSSSRLAQLLEVQPSGISHLLSGRNKPGFELLQKILRRFPTINPDWLLLDDPQMYRSAAAPVQPLAEVPLFSETPPESNIPDPPPIAHEISHSQGDVRKMILLYDDRTFEEYRMREK